MTIGMIGQTSELLHRNKIGPFAESEEAEFWQPGKVVQSNWQLLAEDAGELVDIQAWQTYWDSLEVSQTADAELEQRNTQIGDWSS